ncbi:MAG: TAT-variant-translocated molybdopterin oxidoreductase [Verrucomicrobia bacterium]|nr:TAT-variant-translocated molybdopterin oxidoreductase [Verrucomicrobiota bacterium]
MKTVPPTCPEPDSGAKYWRSLDQLADTPEFQHWVEREFPAGASELTDPVSRRHFAKIMSASFLLAGLGTTGCRRPEERILPFSKQPENYVHGMPQYYATAMPTRSGAVPLVVKAHEGRPTKVEGNKEHPDSNGATDLFAQASILNLYDPDRATRFVKDGQAASPEEALKMLGDLSKKTQADGGRGMAFLMERGASPSRDRVQKLLQEKLPNAAWHVYEPVDFDVYRQAAAAAYGRAVTPYVRLDQAKVIVSLDCDFIGSEEDAHIKIRQFSKGRRTEKPGDSMNRLYAVEALFTLTGANADHRLRTPASGVLSVAARLAREILTQTGKSDLLPDLKALESGSEAHNEWIVTCAKDLLEQANRGHTVVLAGHRQPLAVHILAAAMNEALGNTGNTIVFHEKPQAVTQSIVDLAGALNAGQVSTLVIFGGNPAYNAPAELNWTEAQAKAANVIRLGYYEDETLPVKGWHLPLAHYLESWGDARTSDGTLVPVQPLIEPLFGGLTEIEVMARLAGSEMTSSHDIVRKTFEELGEAGDEPWNRFLHDGYLKGSAPAATPVSFDRAGAAKVMSAVRPALAPTKESLEVVFHRDSCVDDGRYANNGWLQELPDPVNKLVWENAISLSVRTARELGLYYTDKENMNLAVPWVKVEVGGRSVEGPVWIQPGQADNTLGLPLGYGRTKTGRVGKGSGFSAYRVRTSAVPHIAPGAKLTAVSGKTHQLATTQNHWAMEGRPIVREATLKQYREHPDVARSMDMEKPPGAPEDGLPMALYPNPMDVPGKDGKTPKEKAVHHWGMSIDLSTCVGCSACVIACQSENNIPIVGKDQVNRNREMHWLRIDRYYTGDPKKSADDQIADPQVANQPMLCQHCESAPCESVCPVNATVHDYEGLNLMVYNRCVGTRYCSNNCPYKVRRFNYFDYARRPFDRLYKSPFARDSDGKLGISRWFSNPDRGEMPEDQWNLVKLAKNPDVSVRMRGVMEKCTFCLQRIERGKIAQKVKAGASPDIEVRDGAVETACQQACPAESIVFGNMKDPNSRVSRLKAQQRDYSALEFLGTRPRLTYLMRLRNPNPAMPDAYEVPLSGQEFAKKSGAHESGEHSEHGAAHGATEGEAVEKGSH